MYLRLNYSHKHLNTKHLVENYHCDTESEPLELAFTPFPIWLLLLFMWILLQFFLSKLQISFKIFLAFMIFNSMNVIMVIKLDNLPQFGEKKG
jgi:hypothetical protein